MDNVIIKRYRELACASIVQGINDWLSDKKATEQELYDWIMDCNWFDYLDLDREYFYVRILRMKRQGVKALKGLRYGKAY